MNHSILAVVLGLGACVAAAGDGAHGAKPGAVDHEMKAMDTDGDGRLSPEEHAAGARRMFETIDADKDGTVTAAEMDAAHTRVTGTRPAQGEMSAAEKIKVVDTDGDGALSAAEHAAGSKAMFAKMDADKDGVLTRAELAAGQAMKMRKAPR
jgi:Ca2+-binding EF-hand superfamily protein